MSACEGCSDPYCGDCAARENLEYRIAKDTICKIEMNGRIEPPVPPKSTLSNRDEKRNPTPLEELRSIVQFYNWMNESFNDCLDTDELIHLYRYCTQTEKAYSELNECPDRWTEEQLKEALNWDGKSGKRDI